MTLPRLVIACAENDLLVGEDGRRYVDLFSAHGAAWLGHAHPRIAARVAAQLERLWIAGALDTAVAAEARRALEAWVPSSHAVAGFYSTGMEAAEFALRLARVVTKRAGAVGF
jgi:4-aminobutyrate aminotransferase-like enzyme